MIRSKLKLALLIVWIGLCYPPAWLAKKLHKNIWRDRIVQFCYKGILGIIGIQLKVAGQLTEQRPLLTVCNHISYLDIFLLGSQMPVRFTPKEEIASWPVVGNICRLCDAVFIDRQPKKVSELKDNLQATLGKDEVVCLFPEATTGNGLHLLPFKSSFFSLAETRGAEIIVQPIAISYTRIRRLPIDSTQWPDIAWYGDMKLMPHLLKLFALGRIDAELHFLPAIAAGQFNDRKELASYCHQEIGKALAQMRERKPEPTIKTSGLRRFLSRNS